MNQSTGSKQHFTFHVVCQVILEYRLCRSVAQTCHKYGITPKIFHLWHSQYAGVPSHTLKLLLYFQQKLQLLEMEIKEKDLEISRLEEIIADRGGDQRQSSRLELNALSVDG